MINQDKREYKLDVDDIYIPGYEEKKFSISDGVNNFLETQNTSIEKIINEGNSEASLQYGMVFILEVKIFVNPHTYTYLIRIGASIANKELSRIYVTEEQNIN